MKIYCNDPAQVKRIPKAALTKRQRKEIAINVITSILECMTVEHAEEVAKTFLEFDAKGGD